MFLLEVVERRTGLLSGHWLPRGLFPRAFSQRARRWTALAFKPRTRKVVTPAANLPKESAAEPVAPGPPAENEKPDDGMLDALSHAQQRARKRTERR